MGTPWMGTPWMVMLAFSSGSGSSSGMAMACDLAAWSQRAQCRRKPVTVGQAGDGAHWPARQFGGPRCDVLAGVADSRWPRR
jgi:hypothetical protein